MKTFHQVTKSLQGLGLAPAAGFALVLFFVLAAIHANQRQLGGKVLFISTRRLHLAITIAP